MSRTLAELAERCLLPGFVGTSAPDWVRRRAASGLGGVVLYGRNVESPEQLRRLTGEVHSERPELLVAIDEEGGDVTRLEVGTGSSYPGNLALGQAGDLELTRAVAAALGSELAAAGIDLDLAPDADVNSNPANPVIGVRSFGAQPALVAAHTAAFVEGLQGVGVAACAKHFPGHGDTSTDSHLELPVAAEEPRLGALEPFRAAIAAGVRSVMSAHLLVPSLDSVPATLSRPILTDLLRGELGFRGLVITDGLEMRAISDGVGVAEGAVQALVAGCDALCIGGGLAQESIVDELGAAIVEAVRSGRLSEERLAEAAGRIHALAAWRAGQQPAPPAAREVGLEAARRALKVEGEVRAGTDALVVQLRPGASIAVGAVAWGIAASALSFDGPPVDLDRVLRSAAGRGLVLVVRDLHRHPWQVEAVEALLARRPDAVLVEMGLPACRPERAHRYLATFGAGRVNGEAAAEMVLV